MGSPRPSPKPKIRLQRYLASCGLGSRRACEGLIEQGRIEVDGEVVERQGVTVDPNRNVVTVEGRRVIPQPSVYLMVHKPRRMLCTSSDPRGRPTIHDVLPASPTRLYTVGRLDWDSEGLLLVTSDGEFCHALSHPRHDVAKIYRVWLDAPLTPGQQERIRDGVWCDGECLRAADLRTVRSGGAGCEIEIVLKEGRNRHIRRMMEGVGRSVRRLRREAIGPLKLGRLAPGAWRALRPDELRRLRSAAAGPDEAARSAVGGRYAGRGPRNA